MWKRRIIKKNLESINFMKNNMNWNYPTNIWFGEGKIEDLADACLNLKIKNRGHVEHLKYKI